MKILLHTHPLKFLLQECKLWCITSRYSSSLLLGSSSSISDRSMSSSKGSSPSLPSQGSVGLIFGSAAPLTGAVEPLPYDKSLQ